LLDLCIVGLGNPGDKHKKTRHNAGYDFVELLANNLNVELKDTKKLDALYGELSIGSTTIALVKPNEFINNSGKTLNLLKKYKIQSLKDVLIVHDDMDLEPGEVKLKDGGGHSGHNGLKDIINRVGSDFMRLRFGIGHPPVKKDTNSWVIKRPNPEEKKSLDEAFKKTLSSLDQLLDKDWLIVMNNLHSK
jgi:PTH1 family peptidyl-tRNA hydrolase